MTYVAAIITGPTYRLGSSVDPVDKVCVDVVCKCTEVV